MQTELLMRKSVSLTLAGALLLLTFSVACERRPSGSPPVDPTALAPPSPTRTPSKSVLVDPDQIVQPVEIEVGQVVRLQIPGNSTTGYRWVLRSAPTIVSAVGSDYRSTATPQLPGSGGVFDFDLLGASPGVDELTFEYSRGDEPADRSIVVPVRVVPAPGSGSVSGREATSASGGR